MALSKKVKSAVIADVAQSKKDTGSPEVQIAIFTERIKRLSEHLKEHPKDLHSKRGLLRLLGKRRQMLHYIRQISGERYKAILKKLNLKK